MCKCLSASDRVCTLCSKPYYCFHVASVQAVKTRSVDGRGPQMEGSVQGDRHCGVVLI